MPSPLQRSRATLAVLLLQLVLLASGCASFAGGKLPEVRLAEVERAGRLPAITYVFTAAGGGAVTNAALPSLCQTRVEPLFRR